jgi:tetratricopeptide (TPR) repeat protein
MTPHCDQVTAFVAGELPADEHEKFAAHLADCDRCAEALHDELQLTAIEIEARQEAAAEPAAKTTALRRRVAIRAFAAAAALAAAAAVLWVALDRRRGPEPPPSLALAPTRSLEARLTHPEADRHRPYDVARSGSAAAVERIDMSVLAALERRGDRRGLAAAHLLSGDAARAERALAELDGDDPRVLSDRGAAAHAAGDLERALALLDRAIERAPEHPQAWWNRGLVARDLGLPLEAAESLARVAEIGEPGWSEEAAERSAALRQPVAERIETYLATFGRVRAAIASGGVPAADDLTRFPGVGRLMLYDAIRAAPDAGALDGLAPAAATIDSADGGDHLTRAVASARRADWRARGPLAARYAAIVAGEIPSGAELEAYLARLRRARQGDILFGALLRTSPGWVLGSRHIDEYEQIAERSGDPWHRLVAAEQRAARQSADGAPLAAIETLSAALATCERLELAYRCASLATRSAEVWLDVHRPDRAIAAATDGLRWAGAAEEHYLIIRGLQAMAAAVAERGDIEIRHRALARAYLGELRRRDPENCRLRLYVERMQAMLASNTGDVEGAARADDAAEAARLECGMPLDPASAYIRAQIAYQSNAAVERVEALVAAIESARGAVAEAAVNPAIYDAAAGRAWIRRDPTRGRALLESAIAAAERLPATDVIARKVRAYAHAGLAAEAGRRGDAAALVDRLAAEIGVAAPRRCVAAIVWDDGPLAVAVRDAKGEAAVHVEPRVASEAGLESAAAVLARLDGCEVIDVIARPPHHGRPALLPRDLAWRYLTGPSHEPAARPGGPRVVVADVPTRPGLELPRLQPWRGDSAGAEVIRGAAATPARVLAAMAGAAVIEIHAHGLQGSGAGGESVLMLAPGPRDAGFLAASDLAATRLTHAPLVILGACHGGAATANFHASSGLPAAFRRAGARTVLASTGPMPDADAGAVLDELRRRIEAGGEPAVLLRDLRMARARGDWVNQLIVFQ